MFHRRSVPDVLLPACLALALAVSTFAQTPASRFSGVWTLNVPRSTFNPGPSPKSAVLRVDYEGSRRRSALDTVTADGSMTRSEYSAELDGKDYPLKGSPNADTVSLRQINSTTIERTDKRRGRVVMTITMRLSRDGKAMTVTQKGITAAGDKVDNTLVFDKH